MNPIDPRLGLDAAPSFTLVAEAYDELMKPVPYRMWVGYYLLLLSMQGVKPRTLLDVCCGTGTMAEMLHAEGYDVAGFDLSPAMIAVARQKAGAKHLPIHYSVADAAKVALGRQFDAAYSFFDSLNNITDPDAFTQALARVAEHLPSGGSFIFDLNTAFAFAQKMFDQHDMRRSSEVRYRWRSEWDPKELLCTVHMRFWRHGQRFDEVHVQRAHPPEWVEEKLIEVGFTEVRSYSSYTIQPPTRRSDRIHFTAIKA